MPKSHYTKLKLLHYSHPNRTRQVLNLRQAPQPDNITNRKDYPIIEMSNSFSVLRNRENQNHAMHTLFYGYNKYIGDLKNK